MNEETRKKPIFSTFVYRTKTRKRVPPSWSIRPPLRKEEKWRGISTRSEPCASDERLCACGIRSMPTFIDIGQTRHVSRVSDKRRNTVFTFRSNYSFPLYPFDFFFFASLWREDEKINFNLFIVQFIYRYFVPFYSSLLKENFLKFLKPKVIFNIS